MNLKNFLPTIKQFVSEWLKPKKVEQEICNNIRDGSNDLAPRYLTGKVDGKTKKKITDHAKKCDGCKRALAVDVMIFEELYKTHCSK